MEIKKSNKVDLENKRKTYFLLGLILVFALFYVGFEYTSNPDSDGDGEEMADDMSEDIEMLPAMDTRDMIAAAPAAATRAVTEKLKATDKDPDISKKINPNNSDMTQGAAAGLADNRTNKTDENETTALSQVAVDNENNPLNFRVVEQLPEFPGGMVEFMKWITKNLKYPQTAMQNKIQGKVVVSFIINKDGSIASIRIEQGLDPLLDREALRVVRMMPKWKPGLENNKPCRTMFAIPINFKI